LKFSHPEIQLTGRRVRLSLMGGSFSGRAQTAFRLNVLNSAGAIESVAGLPAASHSSLQHPSPSQVSPE
jgi:hypothetical protein